MNIFLFINGVQTVVIVIFRIDLGNYLRFRIVIFGKSLNGIACSHSNCTNRYFLELLKYCILILNNIHRR